MKIKINTHGNPMPERHGDWIDLATAEDVEVKSGEYVSISLGVSMELPKGCYAMVVPRSSTFKKWSLLQANSVGVIDNDYSGPNEIWRFPCVAFKDVFIPKGTRLCQFCVMKSNEAVEFEQDDLATNEDRGGFGSTGTFVQK